MLPSNLCSTGVAATAVTLSALLTMTGCTNLKTPATANLAVADASVNDALNAGGTEYAPLEMRMAREKLMQANNALKDKDYRKADMLARLALADAKLARSKADTAKAQATVSKLQNDIQLLQDQINRANATQ